MDDDNTVWQPIEPTTPVSKYPYEPTAHAPNPYDAIPIPPPPPKKPRKFLGVLLVISLLLFSAAGLFYWTYTYHVSTTQPTPIVRFVQITPTQQPTVDLNYTATDIVDDFARAGASIADTTYGTTIWDFSEHNYFVSVHATSSVIWNDPDSQAPSFTQIGLWVYSRAADAQSAFNQVGQDENNPSPGGTFIPMCCIPQEYLHGRCLLLIGLGGGSTLTWTGYQQAEERYCV